MANKSKEGDIVQLKTGSHTITVKGHAKRRTAEGGIIIADKYECYGMMAQNLKRPSLKKMP